MKLHLVDTIEIVNEFNDLQMLSQSIDESARELLGMTDTIGRLQKIVDYIAKEGYTDTICDTINKFADIEELVGLSAEKIIKYKATEGITDSIKNAAKKFFDGVKYIIDKIIEFFQKLFKTSEYKCKEVVLNMSKLLWDKKVPQYEKQHWIDLNYISFGLAEFLKDKAKVNMLEVQGRRNLEQAMTYLAQHSKGMLKMENGKTVIDPEQLKTQELTLEEAHWTAGDIIKACEYFHNALQKGSEIGAKLNVFSHKAFAILNGNIRVFIEDGFRQIFNAYISQYMIISKVRGATYKQINAFYLCLDKKLSTVQVNPNQPKQLPLAAKA